MGRKDHLRVGNSGLSNIINRILMLIPRWYGLYLVVVYWNEFNNFLFIQVLKRCYSTLLPTSSSYLSTHLTPSADLYGPFWTLTTLIFALFVSSSLSSSIVAYLSHPEESSPTDPIEYDFGLLSVAVGIVYSYGLALPILLWLGLRYLGVGEWSVVEAIAVWGYGQFVWIPTAVSSSVSIRSSERLIMIS